MSMSVDPFITSTGPGWTWADDARCECHLPRSSQLVPYRRPRATGQVPGQRVKITHPSQVDLSIISRIFRLQTSQTCTLCNGILSVTLSV